jgi:YHS domain-containing protein/phenylpyruvate tautomerase PptA (4-oxalocrotonate tautomerase family)
MMFIELFVPKGTLSEEQRRRLSERLITEFMTEEEEQGAPSGVIEANRAIQQVVVHQPDTWIVGGKPVNLNELPRYLVRVSVPGSWRKPMSAEVISRVTRVLAEADPNPQRLYQESVAWVHVIGVPEGSYGMFGKALEGTDLVRLITRPFRESPERAALIKSAPPGTAIDPICGMTLPPSDTALTLEHEGTTYCFCSAGCRQVFLEELRGALPR